MSALARSVTRAGFTHFTTDALRVAMLSARVAVLSARVATLSARVAMFPRPHARLDSAHAAFHTLQALQEIGPAT
jgi:hypothetical protein